MRRRESELQLSVCDRGSQPGGEALDHAPVLVRERESELQLVCERGGTRASEGAIDRENERESERARGRKTWATWWRVC